MDLLYISIPLYQYPSDFCMSAECVNLVSPSVYPRVFCVDISRQEVEVDVQACLMLQPL